LTTGTSLQKYALKLCEDKKRVLVNQHNLELMTYELQGVFSCWSFSFAALSDNAQDILKLCSSLGDGDIPMELLYRGIQGVSCLSNNGMFWLKIMGHPHSMLLIEKDDTNYFKILTN
jgi:hypothetical protein